VAKYGFKNPAWSPDARAIGGGAPHLSSPERRCMEPEGKYSIELFKPGGEGAGLEEILDRHDSLTIA
jgi:hypothetical protein